MANLYELALHHRVPDPSTMISSHEMLSGKVLTKQEMSDRAYSYCGRWLLDNTVSDRHPLFESAGELSTVADWECLEAEKPALYDQLSPLAASMLKSADIAMPFTPQLAEVHSIEDARSRRENLASIETQQASSNSA